MSTTINMQEADFETKDRSAMVLKSLCLQKPCLGKKQGQARAKVISASAMLFLRSPIVNIYCKYSHAYRNQ